MHRTSPAAAVAAELLVDSTAFWARLRADIAAARGRVFVQTMSFEGDAVGQALADALTASGAKDRRLIVDSYSRVVVNDRFLYGPRALIDGPLRAEARQSRALMRQLRSAGVGARFSNPLGPLLFRMGCRNHKKMVVVDDVAYIGGFNFCDHNFAWHDLMVRLDGAAAADVLARDFRATWNGHDVHAAVRLPGLELHLLDGRTNARGFRPLLRRIAAARNAIVVISPYVSWPFMEPLRAASRRGVRVTVLGAERNNHPALGRYVAWQARRSGFDLRLFPDRMNHMKAMLIDDDALVLGSSNFDMISYVSQQEVVAICEDPRLIDDFRRRVLVPDLAASRAFRGPVSAAAGRITEWQLRTLGTALARLRPRNSAPPAREEGLGSYRGGT